MTTNNKPTRKATTKATKAPAIDVNALMERLAQAEANNANLKAQNEALAAQIPQPRIGKKAANYEPARDGNAHNVGAGEKPVTYDCLSPAGTLEIARLARDTFGDDVFTVKALAETMVATMMGAGGSPKYQGKNPVMSARVNGFQRANNAARHNPDHSPWVEVSHDRGAGLYRINLDGMVALTNHVNGGPLHARKWPHELG